MFASFVFRDGFGSPDPSSNSSAVNETSSGGGGGVCGGGGCNDTVLMFNFTCSVDVGNESIVMGGEDGDAAVFGDLDAAADAYQDPTYYSLRYRIVGTVFQSIILLVGILGNVLVIIVVKKITWMQSPTNCYLVSLALADSIVLFASVPNEIIAYYILGDEWLWGRHACAIFVFLQYLGVNASALSITAFTVERYIAICHPMRAQTVCTVHRAKRIIWGVWTFACLYCSPWLLLTDVVDLNYRGFSDRKRCTYALDRRQYLGYYFADLVVFYVVPLIISCVLYGLMARGLVVTLRPATSLTTSRRVNGNSIRGNCRTSTTNTRVQVVKMLVVVVVLFAVLWLPYRVFVVYNSLASNKYMEPWFLMFSKTMIYMNSAINPILYNALSVKFRRAFRRMLVCGAKDSDGSSSSYFESERSMLTVRFRNSRSGASRPPHHTHRHSADVSGSRTVTSFNNSGINSDDVTQM